MKYLLLLFLSSCLATSGDLHRFASQVEEVAKGLDTARAAANQALEVAKSTPGLATIAGTASTLSALGGVVVHAIRNRSREELEERIAELEAQNARTPKGTP